MAEPTPGRPGGQSGGSPRSATAATFIVNDASLKDLHTTWRMLIKDVKDFNAELQGLARGSKSVDQIVAKLGALGFGGSRGGGGVVGTVASAGGRMAGMPPVPVHLGSTIPVGNASYQPPLAGEGGVPRSGGSSGTGGTPALAGGSSPWKGVAKTAGAIAGAAVGGTALFYQSRMNDISDSDLFFNQQAQNTGWGYRGAEKGAARNALFGRPGGQGFGTGVTGYQNPQDLLAGARSIFGATGGTTGGRGMAQLRAAGNLSALTPDSGLAGSAQAVGSLYDPTTSARLMSIGAGPSVGMRGQLQTPQQIYQNVLQRVYRGQKPTAQMITEGLQPGAPLYVTLTQGLGLGPDAIEQFSRYAIAQANLGGDTARTNRAIADASRGRITADTKRAGLTQNIRTSQNLAGAAGARQTIEAGREAEHSLTTGFRALADVTDHLTSAFARLNDATGGRSGDILGSTGLIGGPIKGALNSVGGIGGSIFAAQGVKSLFSKGGGARSVLGRLGMGGAAETGAGEAGAIAGGGELAAVAGPVGIAIAAAFAAHLGGEAMKGNASGRKGIVAAVEDIVGQHLSSSWKAPLNPIGYGKDMYKSVQRHAGWLPFAEGGVVPGNHDRDDVPIRATPGEVVVPKNVVGRHGGAGALMDRLGFRGQGRDGHYAAGGEVTGNTQGLNPSFLAKLRQWAADVGQNFNINSGFRSRAKQQALYDGWMAHRPGFNLAAKPGESNHEYGLAADGPPWGDKHPEKYGLRYAVEGENWHVEPINAKAMRGGATIASAQPSTGSSGTTTVAPSGVGVTAGATGNIAQAPGVLASEKTVMAAFLARSNSPYGVGEPPSAVSAISPKAAGTDAVTPTATVPHAPENASGNIAMGKQKAAARGWTGTEWDSLYQLWNKESSWKTGAANPTSSARGIAQTMMSVHFGKNWQTDKRAQAFLHDPAQQIDWGLNYIGQRYSKPSAAWAHSQSLNWYEKGAWETQDEIARLHKDEMVVPAGTARKLRKLVRDRGADVQSGTATSSSSGPAKVDVHITMPVQLMGTATQQDAHRLVKMVKAELEQDETLATLGSG